MILNQKWVNCKEIYDQIVVPNKIVVQINKFK